MKENKTGVAFDKFRRDWITNNRGSQRNRKLNKKITKRFRRRSNKRTCNDNEIKSFPRSYWITN